MLPQIIIASVRITASAPTRIDLAGGTIDIWPLYLFHPGAQTLNVAISKLPLLGRLAHHFGAGGCTLTTRGESPAGAGIAGSSALNIAVCGALNAWSRRCLPPDSLLEIAQDIEAQVINVPTGLQDYYPALHGGVAALELQPGEVRRVGLDVDPRELEKRLVLCYTGEPRNSGTNNWDITKRHIDGDAHVFDCFERIRDTASAMRQALAASDWDGVARHLAVEWSNRKRLAPGVSTPGIDDLITRAAAAGAQAAKVCGAGGGGCLFCFGDPADIPDIRQALRESGARVLDFKIETRGLEIDTF
jgi:D-glycero-alpha-D-manno-heptose-7-phosphate kinase